MTCAGGAALFPPCGHGAELPDLGAAGATQDAGGEFFDEAEGDVGDIMRACIGLFRTTT
jgi:hypothetical protein